MKVRPSDGNQPHIALKPAGRDYKKSSDVGAKALDGAIYRPKKFNAENEIPNAKEAKQTTKVAFRQFGNLNKPNR